MCAQHYNLGMCVGKTAVGPQRSGSPWVQSNTLFTKYPPSRKSQSQKCNKSALRVSPGKRSGGWESFLPCVPAAAAGGGWQGWEDAAVPQSSGSLAQIGDERTWWHCRFLYKQEVRVAPERTLHIIGYYP